MATNVYTKLKKIPMRVSIRQKILSAWNFPREK